MSINSIENETKKLLDENKEEFYYNPMCELLAQSNIYFCFIEYAKVFDCVDHNKVENS